MLYMVIERFKEGATKAIYQRSREHGRMLPDGLTYINSWVTMDGTLCYQLMECDDPSLLNTWAANWEDLVDFEFVAVQTSAEASNHFGS